MAGKFAKNLCTNGDAIESGILYGLLAGIVGARIGFLLQNPSIFLDKPFSLISLTPSMLNSSFGVLVAGLTLIIFFQKKHLPLWPTLDTISPLVLILFTGIHLADYANGNNYGLPTTLPWGIRLWSATRHPVQLYVIFLELVFFLVLLARTRKFKQTGFLHSGVLFSTTITGLSLITLITRAFVAEKITLLSIDLVQAGSLIIMAAGLYLIYSKSIKPGQRTPVFLSLGSNRNAEQNLTQASAAIADRFKLRSSSSRYQTGDVREKPEKNQYVNLVLQIEVDTSFMDLLIWSKDLETKFGRQPGDKNNVPLDVDIIVYNGDVFTTGGKQLPDPNLLRYKYIAFPLAEIAPDFRHPATGQSIQEILTGLKESEQPIEKLTEVENATQR